MRNCIFFLFIFLFISICNNTQARINETTQQCQDRYGKPLSVKDNIAGYKKSGLLIMIQFYDGKAEMIMFRKAEKNILGTPEELSENEIQALLNANSNKKVWKERNSISLNKEWETEDGQVLAQYDIMENVLYISTKDTLDRAEEEKKAAEEEKLKDF
jgi:hypothetical protein